MGKVSILIVDDQTAELEMMKEILDREGYETVAVGSGEEALQMANQGFDLLLADIFMPHMMGLELVRAFREVSPDTTPMLITGYASVETAKAAVELGIYDNILKPFERDGLCAAVAKALNRKKSTDEKPRRRESIKPPRDGETTTRSQEQSQTRILIVDDQPDVLDMMEEILDREGYETVAVGSGEEALQMASQGFDLLIADIVMPHMGGLELIQEFRKVSPDTVPMLSTGHADVRTAKEAMELDVYDYIVKPFDRVKLCTAVAKACDKKKHTDRHSQQKESIEPSSESESIMEGQEQKQARILIVDDQPDVLDMMKEILDREGYETVAVCSGEEALQLTNQSFDLLLADIVMPHMGGLELIQEFRKVSPDTVPMLTTGHADARTAKESLELGVYDYIVKPCDRTKLCSAMTKALDRKKHITMSPQLKESVEIFGGSESVTDSQEQREVVKYILFLSNQGENIEGR
jgi:DNA-binding NtrC family response regulator